MPKTILIMDDEEDILEATKIILESQDYNIITSSTFSSAEGVAKINPDLILLDFLLVGTNGKAICDKLKKNDKTEHIPIIILSAHPLGKLRSFIDKDDVVGFIQKPFDMHVLIAAVENILK